MRIFLAGIMQGSHVAAVIHDQEYRARIKALLATHIPYADIYDPFADHTDSLNYDDESGVRVFFHHLQLCREMDALIAFLPEASMGTAIEMWEAYRHGRAVIAVSPLVHNWAVKFLSHQVYTDFAEFEAAVTSGALALRIAEIRQTLGRRKDEAVDCRL